MISSTSPRVSIWALYILAAAALLLILYFGQGLFIPMSYGLLIAIVMYLPCRWLEQKGYSRYIAIALCLLLVVLLFTLLLLLLGWQLAVFRKDIPELCEKLKPLAATFSNRLEQEWSLTKLQQ